MKKINEYCKMNRKWIITTLVVFISIFGYMMYTAEPEKGVDRGYTMEDISGTGPKGQTLNLLSIKKKYILIEFWASWCAPCRSFNPKLVELYKNRNSDIEIFSISLDSDVSKWQNAITKDNLTWTYHISDLKGWESPLAKRFNIESIPANILLNEERVIVGKDLSESDIEKIINSKK
jgi:thiol-disulfide isomerase/thioredoxin